MVRRFVHFDVLCTANRMGNPYQRIIFKLFSYGEKSPGQAEDICLHQGCQLRGPKKQILGFFGKIVQGIFLTNTWTGVLQIFLQFWVGNTVFTVPVLCNAKYPKMHEAGNQTLFNF
jgi:hypothetical protein